MQLWETRDQSKQTVRRRRIIVIVAVLLGLLFTSAAPASASSANVQPYHTKHFPVIPIGVPGGFMTHFVQGSGQRVEKEWAQFQPSTGLGAAWSKVCNWHIDIEYYDRNGNKYATHTSRFHPSCDLIGRSDVLTKRNLQVGKVSAVFWENGEVISVSTIYITA